MTVDASIPLQVQPLKLDDPLQKYGQLATIQNAQTQNRLSQLQGDAAQVKLDENAAYKSALADTTNYDDKGNISPEGIQNILKVAPEQGRALLQMQRQNRLTDAQIGYYGARTQKDTVETQQTQHQAVLKDTLDGFQQARAGDLPGALTTFNRNLPKEQQATRLEYIKDQTGKPIGLRAYLPDGSTHDTPDIDAAITQYTTLNAKPDTVLAQQGEDKRAADRNQTTIQSAQIGAGSRVNSAKITAGGRVDAATISASKPHIQTLDNGQVVAVDPRTNQATTITDANGAPIIGKTPVGPDIQNAKIDAAKAYIQAHPRTIADPNNPGQMKKNPDVLMNPNYDSIERLAGMQYIRKPGGNTDTVANPVQQGGGGGKAPPSAPMNPKQRAPNTVYMTPKGPMKWTGTGWLPQ